MIIREIFSVFMTVGNYIIIITTREVIVVLFVVFYPV